MKKIGLLSLALVIALGTLGIGYAMWFDTITINGTVNTGSVDFQITITDGDNVWKDNDTDALVYDHWIFDWVADEYTDPISPPAEPILVAWTTSVFDADDHVTISYNNLFPIPGEGFLGNGCFVTSLHGVYVGTIPAHIKITPSITGIPESWVNFDYFVYEDDFTNLLYSGDDPESVQLHEGYGLSIGIYVCVPQEDTEAENDANMNRNGRIDIEWLIHQWNETPP